MYKGDHIVFNAMLAIVVSRRWSLPLVPLTAIFIVINGLDLDHTLNYYLDDGTANSLVLHPLHRMAGFIIFIIAIVSLICSNYEKWFFSIIIALSAHLFCDQLANCVNYAIPGLVIMGVIQIVIFLYIAIRYVSSGPFIGFIAYILGSWLVAHLVLIFTIYGIHMNPQKDAWFYVIQPSIAILSAILFWLIFSRTALDAQNKPIKKSD